MVGDVVVVPPDINDPEGDPEDAPPPTEAPADADKTGDDGGGEDGIPYFTLRTEQAVNLLFQGDDKVP